MNTTQDWNSFGRTNAMQKWRRQSAMMGVELTRTLVRVAAPRPGMHILDVACGSGEPAISLATELEPGGEVVGIDISADPLEVARNRAAERGLHNVRFEQMDALALSFPDASFDLITCRLGLMFLPDVPKALAGFHRVLKPGGRVAFACWGPFEQPYFDCTAGVVQRMFHAELPETARKMFQFGYVGRLREMLATAGFTGIEEQMHTMPWTWFGTPEQFWEYFQSVTIPLRELLALGTGQERAERDRLVLETLGRHYDGQKIPFNGTFNLTTAFNS